MKRINIINSTKGDGYENVFFNLNNTLCIVRHGKTSNDKISSLNEKVIETLHFSKGQFNMIAAGGAFNFKQFFSHDRDVCLDCPLSMNMGAKVNACYTHKGNQPMGFRSMLLSITKRFTWDQIPKLNAETEREILRMSAGRYIRFGTYGEPSLLPLDLTKTMCAVAKNWTGYTHQHNKRPEFSPFFMASTHDAIQEQTARLNGWRSFVSAPKGIEGLVSCPASKEQNYKSNCSKCGLCSGTEGKGKKSVVILAH
jgi:hypothetical protein